ncbi:MAG: hypothetical protein LDL16_10870 [Thiobacillus sp.]|nr:hypothetical protein [Thiobacillus sp.]
MSAKLIGLSGAGLELGAFSLCGHGADRCQQRVARCARFVQRLARRALGLACALAASPRQPAVGRRCLRSDLEQREIVIRLAAHKAHLAGAARRHDAGPVALKRGRRCEFTPG